ncbi:NAD(P)/FAD-dependent oxidoreductase [Streptomyces olivoreticuli]|uniref:NAD(P)/FAD-dependent oxidoreductase n=1 Tax=Streptomyces olivoreticuli TaxID=68246 RepID=UPI000E26C2A4|nr:FAD-dependent oxidoreductase [Streptomyces olivoreticuli]
MTARRIAVAGAGMAGARFAQQLLARTSPGAVEPTLYGAEPDGPYNRTLLAEVLAGRYGGGDVIGLACGPDAVVRTGAEVTAVDPAARTIALADGSAAGYDVLVLATGAEPVLPAVPGLYGPDGGLLGGVHTFRTLADCRRLTEDAGQANGAVVVGGGVLGVGVARALAARGLPVTLVHRGPYLMNRQLDGGAAGMVAAGLTALGVAVRTATHVRALRGTDRVTAVELEGGPALATGLVVFTCGVRPRTRLARAAGLAVREGIVVDDGLATSAPGIHAIGDCAEHRGTVHGRSGPAWAQADALAARLSGADPDARCPGSRPLTRLTAGPLQLAAFGAPDDGAADSLDVLRVADATRGTYKKLVLRGDRLVGAVLVGDLTAVGGLIRVWRRDEPLTADPLDLIRTPS